MLQTQKLVQDKVVLVTGAGGGIGRDIALAMAREGAQVVVNDIGASVSGEGHNDGPAQHVVNEIRALGVQAVANTDSVAEAGSAARMVQCALDHFGRIDVVVNNAGILRDRFFHKMSTDEWDAVIKVHLYGAYFVSRAAATHFKEQNSGCYIHMTSTSGLVGNFGQANYAAAKAGILGMTRALAKELGPTIAINAICPGVIKTELGNALTKAREPELVKGIALGRLGSPADVAALVVFLATVESNFITGQDFKVDGFQWVI